MINLKLNCIECVGKSKIVYPIVEWQVWFSTPMGLCSNFNDAWTMCREKDFDPEMTIRPVAVAVSKEGFYEAVI